MPQIWVKAPDTPEQTAEKIRLAEQSKAALETCLQNMRKSLIANVNTWGYTKVQQQTQQINETKKAIDIQARRIETLKAKLK